MLTPAFDLSQNDEFLIISIQMPYAKISEYNVQCEDYEFVFSCTPYYLRLCLPGKVQYCDSPKCVYDLDKKTFVMEVPKAVRGEEFKDLDLINLMLRSKKTTSVGVPKIEVLESTDDVEESEEELDIIIDQVPSEDKFGDLNISGQQCGFANSYTYSVFKLKDEAYEIFDITEPETKTRKIRTEERIQHEKKTFKEDHYIADLYEDVDIKRVLKFNPIWVSLFDEVQKNPSEDIIHFTPEEKNRLMDLPSKKYLLDKNQERVAFLGLIDILFAYAYNNRTVEGENTVGSAWTINKLSSTLSWLETFSSVSEVAISCIRRSLVFPLYRHFELSATILEDVRKIILLGRKYIIKCLLEIHQMFNRCDPRYILNELFIVDYILWMQTKRCSSNNLVPLATALEKILLTKGDIGLNLVDIETLAQIAWMSSDSMLENTSNRTERKSSISDLSNDMKKMTLESNSKKAGNTSTATESNSNKECCSSSSSGSSSSSYETDSSVDSDDSIDETDSDDDSNTSDSDSHWLIREASV